MLGRLLREAVARVDELSDFINSLASGASVNLTYQVTVLASGAVKADVTLSLLDASN